MVIVMGFLWVFAIIGALFGFLGFFSTFAARDGATQGVGAAVAVASAVLPYCLARAVSGLADSSREYGELAKLNEQIATHTKLLASLASNQVSPAAKRKVQQEGDILV